MKNISLILLATIFTIAIQTKTFAQGCVAIRSTAGIGMEHPGQADSAGTWSLGWNNRYFKSFRHYVGTDEQKQRQTLGNEVINHVYSSDFALTRTINSRWSIMIDVPILVNARSQTYTQSSVLHRFSTHSTGLGDIRFAVYRWMIDPAKATKGNIQVGLGIKLPTGDYKYQDYFSTSDSTKELRYVDQSIQLGDGGTGFTAEINAFYNLSHKVGLYGNFYYLSNPRNQNGVIRSATPNANAIANGSNVMSVADQYMARIGVNYKVNNLEFSAGVRDECIPVHDLIGGSDGFRRPGYIISAEPGVTYKMKKVTLYGFVPFALVRDRTQSVPDKITTKLTGKYTQGDAAFADYLINVGLSFKL